MKKFIVLIFSIVLIFFIKIPKYVELNNLIIIDRIIITCDDYNYKLSLREVIPIRKDNSIIYKYKYYNAFTSFGEHSFFLNDAKIINKCSK